MARSGITFQHNRGALKKDYGQADLASYRELSNIPQCGMEDGSTSDGYERICEWRGSVDGNHTGTSYVLVDGSKVLEW